MPKLFPKTCVALDLETTDLSPTRGDIIEVAAATFKDNKVIDTFQSLAKPSGKIPKVVSAITGITDDKVKEAPLFKDIKEDFSKFVGNYPIVGHNINFDLNFLDGHGLKLPNPCYDTWKLATLLVPELSSHSLEILANFLKIKHVESHRALDDVLASKDLFLELIKRIYEIDQSTLKDICRLTAKRDWDSADIFKQVLSLRKKGGEKVSTRRVRQHADDITSSDKKTTPKDKISLETVAKTFQDKEKIKRVIKNYEFRPGQVELMKELANDFTQSKKSITGAGPGIGRYMAYLTTAAYHSQKGQEKIAITVNQPDLQREILAKQADIVQKVTPFEFPLAFLENRERYLCLRRLEQLKAQKSLPSQQINSLVKLLLGVDSVRWGLFSEMAWTFDDFEVSDKTNCNENFCLQKRCPYYQECFYYKALNQAQKADIILFNHWSLAANAQAKEKIPFKHIILDEAQDLEKQFTNFLSCRFGENDISQKLDWLDTDPGFLNIIPKKALLKKSTKDKIKRLQNKIAKLKNQTGLFFGVLGIFTNKQKQDLGGYGNYFTPALDTDVRQYPEWDRVRKAGQNYLLELYAFLSELDKLIKSLKQKSAIEINCDLSGVYLELYQIAGFLQKIVIKPELNKTAWLFLKDDTLELHLAPPTISNFMDKELLPGVKSVNFVATILDSPANVKYFRKRLGLSSDYSEKIIKTHYNYEKQVKIIVPTDIAGQNQPGFNQEIEKIIKDTAKVTKGKLAVSCGSKAAIRRIYEDISLDLKEKGIKVLGLGVSGGKDKVLQEFKANNQSVLLATHDFILENEFPSDSLDCLIIHKLPFGFFSDPLIAARKAEYQDDFNELIVPEALIKFRQIFQKLIASTKDKGIFVVLDNRVESAQYGAEFLKALPSTTVEYGEHKNIGNIVKKWL